MKEEMLRNYLADELFAEKGYLKPGEAATYQWRDPRKVKLIEVIKVAIDGETGGENEKITERKINQLLNVGS